MLSVKLGDYRYHFIVFSMTKCLARRLQVGYDSGFLLVFTTGYGAENIIMCYDVFPRQKSRKNVKRYHIHVM